MWLAKHPFVLRKTRTSYLTKWAVSVCTHQCGRLLLHPRMLGRVLRRLVYVMWPVNANKSVIAVMPLKILCENWFCLALFWQVIDTAPTFPRCTYSSICADSTFGEKQQNLVKVGQKLQPSCRLCTDGCICCIKLCIHAASHRLWHGTVGFLFLFFFFLLLVRWIHRTVSSPISVCWACKSALSVQFEQSGPGAMYSSGHLNIPAVAKWHRAQASRLR